MWCRPTGNWPRACSRAAILQGKRAPRQRPRRGDRKAGCRRPDSRRRTRPRRGQPGEKRAGRVAEEQALQAAWNNLGRLLQADTVDDVLQCGAENRCLAGGGPRAIDFAQPHAGAAPGRAGEACRRPRRAPARAAAHIQVLAAEDTLKTQLDFVGSLNTNGLREGSNGAEFRPVATRFPRSMSDFRCACRWRARWRAGLVTTRQSAHRQAVIRLHEAEGNVGSALVTATSALRELSAP
jgi:hypothetical protein